MSGIFKPTPLDLAVIPAELRERPQWVVWRLEARDDGRLTKVPYRASDPAVRAKSTERSTWASYQQAVDVYERGEADGIGYVFAADDPYVGIDVDGLADEERDWIVQSLDSYTERSVSGTGLHVIVRGRLERHGRHPAELGVFDQARYFVVTGDVTGGRRTIEDRQAELDAALARFLPALPPPMAAIPSTRVDLDDRELLDRALAAKNGADVARLWDGDWSGYPSQSEADLALCCHLAFWTGRDPERIDRLFRASGLMREKWLRDNYRTGTIERALAGTRDVYRPPEGHRPMSTDGAQSRSGAGEAALSRNVGRTSDELSISPTERRESQSDIPGKRALGVSLADVLSCFGELLFLPDSAGIKVGLAAVVANYAAGDSSMVVIVGPPGCGKSEIVTALSDAPGVWGLSSLTPQTLLSGYERKSGGKPASLLMQIGSFGILAFKDLTTVLTMHREARAEIIGQLREVADGKVEKSFGNGLRVEWTGKLGLIAGVTPVIDEQHQFLAVMGERFLLFRLPEVPRREITRRSLARRGHEPELRGRLRKIVGEFLAQFREVGRLDLPDGFTEPLIVLADVVTRARSGVARDWQTRELLYLPEPEAPTRFAKQVAQLTAAMLAIGVGEDEAWLLARKVGWDSVPAVRCQVIELLSRQREPQTMAALQEQTGLPATTVGRVVEDLVALDLIRRRKEAGKWLVEQGRLMADYWASERDEADQAEAERLVERGRALGLFDDAAEAAEGGTPP